MRVGILICLGVFSMLVAAADAPNGDAAQPGPKGVCKADVKSLCADVKPGGGRIIACLKQNEDKLSDGCKTALAKHAQKADKAAGGTASGG